MAAKFGDENFDDIAQATWGFNTSHIYRDSLGTVSTIAAKGYQKYCYEYAYYCVGGYIGWSSQYQWLLSGTSYNNTSGTYDADSGNCFASNPTNATCGVSGSDAWYK